MEDKELSVVLKEAKFDVVITAEAPMQVNVGESAKIEVGQAIDYIKSGEAEINAAVTAGTNAFNANATAKTNAFNQNATDKTTDFNNNASAKTQDYNDNAVTKTTAYNDNATDKTNAFNSNATDKTTAFNNNATAKTGDFDTNATNKTNTFNQNASDKTTAFNNNATAKTNDFNDNYTAKKALIDAQVAVAEGAATTATNQAGLAKQWAIGDPSEPTGNSAKYWAEQAASELSGLTSRVSTIEGKIPSEASSSNQLADKAWVGEQGYITGITSGDVTTALGYTPYDASNPNGYTSNVGTVTSVNNTSPDGNGNVTITIPDPLPSQTGQSGKFLTTDGTDASWANVDALPSQTGQSGKYLTTDGTDASWATISIPSVDIDGKSITRNTDDELQTIGVINQNDTTTALKTWSGTKAQYDAIVTKDANTLYNITDDTVPIEWNALDNIPNEALTYASTITLSTNMSYRLTLTGDIAFVLPSPTANKLNQIEVQLYMATAYTIDLGTTYYFNEEAPDLSADGYYTIVWEYDWLQSQWVVGAVNKGVAS